VNTVWYIIVIAKKTVLLLIARLSAECLTVPVLLLTVPHLCYRFALFVKDQMCKEHIHTIPALIHQKMTFMTRTT
jgi:hypothetical protein